MFANASIVVSHTVSLENVTWQRVDQALREIAKRRAALDADEARWLREAQRLQIWKELGFVSGLDYCDRILGHKPRTAQDRLRVAKALGELPHIEAALHAGDLSYSAVREITRVATPDKDELVAMHERGDSPTDPAKAIVKDHNLALALPSEIFAMFRQVQSLATEEAGRHLEDHELIGMLCRAYLDRGSLTGKTSETKHLIALTVCEQCGQGWQHGGGRKIPVDAAAVEAARCDALDIGSIDGDKPERASHRVPPAVMRFVFMRDGGRCQTPGCRSTVGVQFHHIDPQCEGGPHTPENGTSRCFACHAAIHHGKLIVTGTAPNQLVNRWVEGAPPYIAKERSSTVAADQP